GRVAAHNREAAHRAVRQIERRIGCHQFGSRVEVALSKICNANSNSTVDLQRQNITPSSKIIDMSQRVRREIVGSNFKLIRVQIQGPVRATINRISGVPRVWGGVQYIVVATTSLERDRATSQVHLLSAGSISGHFNRLAAQIKRGSIGVREIVEREA